MAKPSKPAVLEPARTADGQDVIAEFDLRQSRCCIVPVAQGPSQDAGESGVLGEFEHGGIRYRVLERRPRYERFADRSDFLDPTGFLTVRELQIVRLICFGCVNKQIADRLSISEYTVKTYLKQIFMKLNVHSRSAVVYRCAGWVGSMPAPRPGEHS